MILRDIESGVYKDGDRMPSRADLARRFSVSKSAAGCALQQVGRVYPLESVPGRGLFLNKSLARKPFVIGMIGTWASWAAVGGVEALRGYHSYYPPILQSVIASSAAENCAVTMVPETAEEPLPFDRIEALGIQVAICHGLWPSRETVREFRRRGLPLVLGHRGDGSRARWGCSYVDYDWAGACRAAVRLFHERGHRRIAFVYSRHATGGGWDGWREAFILEAYERGLWPEPEFVTFTEAREEPLPEWCTRRTAELLDRPDPPTAIFAKQNSANIEPVIAAVEERGLKVGRDVSLLCLGVRGLETHAPVSVLVEPAEKLGSELVRAVTALREDPDAVIQVDVPFVHVDQGSIADLR